MDARNPNAVLIPGTEPRRVGGVNRGGGKGSRQSNSSRSIHSTIMLNMNELKMKDSTSNSSIGRRYSTGDLVRRLLALAWQFRGDCLLSLGLSLALLLLGLLGLQLLGLVIDVIRHALDPLQQAPPYPYGWIPPAHWTPLQIVTALSLAIVAQALF